MANMMLEMSWSSVMPTLPTATPMQRTFLSWNLMVDLTSVILLWRSSLWETGVGNLPAADLSVLVRGVLEAGECTLGKTWTQKTWNLLDQGVGSDESIVLASELLDQLLVLVELLQVISGHGVNTTVLGTIDIVLVTENAIYASDQILPSRASVRDEMPWAAFDIPDAHVWAWNLGETDGSRETLVTLRIIVLEADLQFDGLEEVALLGLEGVVEELLDVGTHSGCRKIASASHSSTSPCASCFTSPKLRINVPTEILEAMIASLPIGYLLVRICAVVS